MKNKFQIINTVSLFQVNHVYFLAGTVFFVDAMSSFGAVPLDFEKGGIDFMVSSANKCLQGVPGFSYAVCRNEALDKCKGMYSRKHVV